MLHWSKYQVLYVNLNVIEWALTWTNFCPVIIWRLRNRTFSLLLKIDSGLPEMENGNIGMKKKNSLSLTKAIFPHIQAGTPILHMGKEEFWQYLHSFSIDRHIYFACLLTNSARKGSITFGVWISNPTCIMKQVQKYAMLYIKRKDVS